MRTKTTLAFVALIAGFAVGRSTVPNIDIGADPDEFKARGLDQAGPRRRVAALVKSDVMRAHPDGGQ